jgi:transcription elongation factor Elf1
MFDCDYCGFGIHYIGKEYNKYVFQCGDCGHLYKYECEDLVDRLLEIQLSQGK